MTTSELYKALKSVVLFIAPLMSMFMMNWRNKLGGSPPPLWGRIREGGARSRGLCAMTSILALLSATPTFAQSPLPAAKTQLTPFDVSAFPYRGEIPDKNMTFMDVVNGERLGHTSARGGVYWEDLTYSDRRTLLYIPRGFDI